MATLRKVGDKWRVEVRRKGVSKSARFKTKGEAKAWGELVERRILGGVKEYSKDITFEFVCDRYLREISNKKKGARWEAIRINKFMNEGLGLYTLEELTPKFWRGWISKKLESLAPNSVIRELNLISAVFAVCCAEWEYMEVNPLKSVKRPKGGKHRDRLVSDSEQDLIVQHLGLDFETSSGQVSIAFLIALETGMRRSEILALEWANVFINQRYLTVMDSKNGDKRDIPLSSKCIEIIQGIKPKHDKVFTIKPETLSTLFRRACKSLSIEGLTFHDSRHSAVVKLARKLDVLDLARMIGHRDIKNLMIYYNEPASEIAKRLD